MRSLVLVVLAACGACGGGSSAMVDAPPDLPLPPDTPNPCTGTDVFLSGELLDWDSSTTTFKGVFMAQIKLAGNVLLTTPPNGRLDECVTRADPLRLDVDAPPEYLDGSMVIEVEAITSLHPISLRDITATRAQSFYTERGLTFDPTKAHVLVFEAGDRGSLTLDRPHDATQSGNDDASPGDFVWTAGDTGRYVLFPNVDVAQPTGTIGGDASPHVVPLVANQLTMVAISFVFL